MQVPCPMAHRCAWLGQNISKYVSLEICFVFACFRIKVSLRRLEAFDGSPAMSPTEVSPAAPAEFQKEWLSCFIMFQI